MKIILKKAGFQDIEFLWYLRNQPEVFKYFKNPKKVKWEEHLNWIMPILLGFGEKELFVIVVDGKRAGQLRFDYAKRSSQISISLLKEFQGKGAGSKSLNLALKKAKSKKIIAEIHESNIASRKLFEKFGFNFKEKKGVWLKYES